MLPCMWRAAGRQTQIRSAPAGLCFFSYLYTTCLLACFAEWELRLLRNASAVGIVLVGKKIAFNRTYFTCYGGENVCRGVHLSRQHHGNLLRCPKVICKADVWANSAVNALVSNSVCTYAALMLQYRSCTVRRRVHGYCPLYERSFESWSNSLSLSVFHVAQ